MARPYWSGQIQISLVQFGVSLYTATESKSQISFHQISRSTGERIRHQKVLQSAAESDESTSAVGKDDIVKGYEYSKGQYVLIEPNELENLRGLGHLLISLRIAQGISQRELAKRLDVHESQVSRDERNEYFGNTLERAIKISDALSVRLHTTVELEPPKAAAVA